MSFTLNRVYTEWYRNQGFNFTILINRSPKWMSGRNIYSNISVVVDTIINNYLSRPGVSQPILTSTVTVQGYLVLAGSLNGSKN